jgi:hypothetical protein
MKMKTDIVERWLLLEQSGELDAVRRWLLHRHLRAHPGDLAFRDDLRRITEAARAARPDVAIRPEVMQALRQAARDASSRSEEIVFQPAARPVPWTRPLLIAAGLLLLLAGGIFLAKTPDQAITVVQTPPPAVNPVPEAVPDPAPALAWEDDFDKELAELDSLVAVSGAEWDDSNGGVDADSLARELLELGGAEI